jgi:hypothetical protein
MTLVVEDGTGLSNANTYASVDEFTTFMTDRGETTIAEADTDQKEIALIKSADYMMQKYRLLWKGSRAQTDQRLDWPRRGVDVPDFFDPFYRDLSNIPLSFQDTLFIPENEVPTSIKEGQMLIAKETFSGDQSSGTLQDTLGRVTKREKLGVLEVEYFNSEDGSTRQTTLYWDAGKHIEWALALVRLHSGQLVRN